MATDTRGVEITGPVEGRREEILTPEALDLLALLHRTFDGERRRLLGLRAERQAERDRGATLDFLAETAEVRDGDWTVAPPPPGLQDRRVEITGPTSAKMVINALNSGAPGFMADFEDSNSPCWANMVDGQVNLRDAVRHALEYDAPDAREYRLGDEVATLLVRPRGLHLPERHVLVDGEPIAGAFMDFGLFLLHNAAELLDRGSGPFFYLPKLESHLEARPWNEVFTLAEREVGVPHGSARATVLIETFPAAFEMDEILYELREHSAGLNAGRWDYIFSAIKTHRTRPDALLPDRNDVTMTVPFMRAYTELLVATCHRRGAFAMGGMSAFLPSRTDEEANRKAMAKVREDKQREAEAGFDGTWVAHPDFVAPALEQFDAVLGDKPNQIDRQRPDVAVSAADLLAIDQTPGAITEQGLRNDVNVGIQYISSWLRGNGAAGIYGLMEDAATAEIARSQVWQWVHHGATLDGGEPVTAELVRRLEDEELERIRGEIGDDAWFEREGRPELSKRLFEQVALADELADFLTLPAYEELLRLEADGSEPAA
jgi:malate synthase